MYLYILYINPIAFPSEITIQVGENLTNYSDVLDNYDELQEQHSILPSRLQSTKYMDDATIQEALDLRNITFNSDQHQRVLPQSYALLQDQINSLKNIRDQKEMRLNCSRQNFSSQTSLISSLLQAW